VTKWLEIDQDNLHRKFSALNVDFSSPSPDPLGSKRPAQAGVKDGYPLRSGYYTSIGSCSVKTVADRHRHAAYHNKQVTSFLLVSTFMTLNPQNSPGFLVIFLQFLAVTHILRVSE